MQFPLHREIVDSGGNLRQNPTNGSAVLLNSWKEVAQYLGRGVRTVQRWERELGLPVHRPNGRDRSATLALASELDEWLRGTPVRSRASGNGGTRVSGKEEVRGISIVREGPSPTIEQQHYLILSVADEPALRLTREKMLRSEGYEVVSAADGEKALKFIAIRAVDLVLIDDKTRGMNGGTVAGELKEHIPQVPVIMMSADRVPAGAVANVDCFLPKGDRPELLLAAIHQLLAASAMTREAKLATRPWSNAPQYAQSRHN
jgi:CheY-like chemotaxis protein